MCVERAQKLKKRLHKMEAQRKGSPEIRAVPRSVERVGEPKEEVCGTGLEAECILLLCGRSRTKTMGGNFIKKELL